jgi:hypothetical protein
MNWLLVIPFAEGIDEGLMLVECPAAVSVGIAHEQVREIVREVKERLPDEWEANDMEQALEAAGFRCPPWMYADFVR